MPPGRAGSIVSFERDFLAENEALEACHQLVIKTLRHFLTVVVDFLAHVHAMRLENIAFRLVRQLEEDVWEFLQKLPERFAEVIHHLLTAAVGKIDVAGQNPMSGG